MILPVTAPGLENDPSGVGQDAVYEVGVPCSVYEICVCPTVTASSSKQKRIILTYCRGADYKFSGSKSAKLCVQKIREISNPF